MEECGIFCELALRKWNMATRTLKDLQMLQALPLSVKVGKTKQRIKEWVDEYGEDGVYVSFSGGKDSTVLLDIVRSMYPNIPAVFVDTGLEYPEIRKFVQTFDNVTVLKPKMNFMQVIKKHGYPMIGKEIAECAEGARKYLTSMEESGMLDRPTDRPTDRGRICLSAEPEDVVSTQNQKDDRHRQVEQTLRNIDGIKTKDDEGCRRFARITGTLTKDNRIKADLFAKIDFGSSKKHSRSKSCGDCSEREKSSNSGEYP